MEYQKRIIDDVIDYYSDMIGCLYIKGPKWVGKTTTAINHSKTIYRLGVKRNADEFTLRYNNFPETIFEKEKPILFDEWQECPYLWDEIKNQVDIGFGQGNQFFITGSNELTPEEKNKFLHHSGTGRILDLIMRPMSLFESHESNGSISLLSLFDEGINISGKDSSLSLNDLIFATCRGGWPMAVQSNDRSKALKYVGFILDRVIHGEEKMEDEEGGIVVPSSQTMERVIRSYAKNTCTLTSNERILAGAKGDDVVTLSRKTYDSYKNKLIKHYLIEEVEAWYPAFKSRSALSSASKKCFMDPSLAIHALSLSEKQLQEDLIGFGYFFENLCIRDLRVYSSKYNGKVFYYRDKSGKEVDAVLLLDDGRYALIECKLGFMSASKAADNLLNIKKMMEEHNASIKDKSEYTPLPSSLIVLHGGKEALSLSNGVHLVPIGSLKD